MNEQYTPQETLSMLLRTLRLPSFAAAYEDRAARAEREGWTFGQYLNDLCELEVADRGERRIERLRRKSELPKEKSLATLDRKKLPKKVARQLSSLCEGGFLRTAENLLVFGLPGRGKTHLVCAIGHELVRRGHSVLFTPTYRLVQRLLAAKRDLTLERELQRLDGFEAIILDDIGYVQQDRDEMEVLFTFLAQRYARRSVMITSNLVFSQWDRIFKDAMTTAAAIDRLVHHSIILEMEGPSIRNEEAKKRTTTTPTTTTPTTTTQNQDSETSGDGEV
jgi:DNA replication protein DnaC